MTTLARPVRREVAESLYEQGKYRPVIVSLEPPTLLGFRLKGTHRSYYLPASTCYLLAVRAHVAAEPRVKQAARQAKRRGV